MDRNFIARHWYASIYEQLENQTNDVEFFLSLIAEQTDGKPQRILEVACGGGRILEPLARAGHDVTGFDADEHMLLNCYRRTKGLANARCFHLNAVDPEWGKDYDIVVMGGNVLINIEWTDVEYKNAQIAFIQNAAKALRSGGHLLMEFDLHSDPSQFFNDLKEGSYFTGYDDIGTFGRTMSYGSVYDPETRIVAGSSHVEVIAVNGDKIICPNQWVKHIPTQTQVYSWLSDAGLVIEHTYRDFTNEPIPEPIDAYCTAVIWARKA